MDISEIITIVREDYLDDVFEGWKSATEVEKNDQFLWSDNALLRYLTEAQRQACNRTDFIYDDESFTITLVAGSPSYSINQKITVIEQVTYDNDKTVIHMSKEDFQLNNPQWRTRSGIANDNPIYTIRGRKLRIYPIPDVGDAGKILTFDTYRLPIDSITTISDDLEIPEEYHRDLIWWVLYEAYSKQDADGYDKERGLRYLAQFNEAFGAYVPSEVRLNQLQEDKTLRPRPIDYISNSNSSSQSVWNV